MIPSLGLIDKIQSRTGKGPHAYVFLATLERPSGRFREYAYPQGGEPPLVHQPHGHDLFFTPLTFKVAARTVTNAHVPGVLFCDGDEADLPSLQPSVLWWTSDRNWQAVWFLDSRVEKGMWSDLNRRLTYHLGADRGGWSASKLLRVPESVNWKRKQFGRMGEVNLDLEYEPSVLDSMLPHLGPEEDGGYTLTHPGIVHSAAVAQDHMLRMWPKLGMLSRSMLAQEQVRDRSMHIVRTVESLLKDGVPTQDVFHLIWWRPWNKWRTDRTNPARLWYEITRLARQGH